MKIDIRTLPTKYINMEKDFNRNTNMVTIGDNLKFKDYTRAEGFYTPGVPHIGCAISHYTVLKDIKGPAVVLEDDCIVRHDNLIIEVPDDADAVYLGLSAFGHLNSTTEFRNYTFSKNSKYPGVSRIDGMLATHAILYISDEYLALSKRIAKWSAMNNGHIDNELTKIHKYYNIYALNDPIFYQSSNASWTNFILGETSSI